MDGKNEENELGRYTTAKGASGRLVRTCNEACDVDGKPKVFSVCNKRAKQILEDILVLSILEKAEATIKDEEGYLANIDNNRRLSNLNIEQVAAGWNCPDMLGFLNWEGGNNVMLSEPMSAKQIQEAAESSKTRLLSHLATTHGDGEGTSESSSKVLSLNLLFFYRCMFYCFVIVGLNMKIIAWNILKVLAESPLLLN